MSDIQVLQLLGLTLLAVSISAILDRGMLKKLFLSFADNYAVLFLSWLLALVMGCLIILTHKMWWWVLHEVVLVIWYLSLIKWLFLLVYPALTTKMMKNISNCKWVFITYPILLFAFSLICLFLGFMPLK